jgi:hypothetical protein
MPIHSSHVGLIEINAAVSTLLLMDRRDFEKLKNAARLAQ